MNDDRADGDPGSRRTALTFREPSPLVPLRCTLVHLAGSAQDPAAEAFLACAGGDRAAGAASTRQCEMVVRTQAVEAPLRITTRSGSAEYVLRVVATRPLRPAGTRAATRGPNAARRASRDIIPSDDHWMLDIQISRIADARADESADRLFGADAAALVESTS
jgi:hypothetical protein